MKYYSLIMQDASGRWFVEFGDYDKDVVADEKQDKLDHGVHRTEVAIIVTEDDQASIQAKVDKLNAA